MPLFETPFYTIDVLPGWSAATLPDGAVAFRSPSGDAELRFTTFDAAASGTTPADWVSTAAHFNAIRGRPAETVACGDFRGSRTTFRTETEEIRGWVLAAGAQPLDVTYRCPVALAGRDDVIVEAMLRSLRSAGGAV